MNIIKILAILFILELVIACTLLIGSDNNALDTDRKHGVILETNEE